jgi:hypothetical protein
VVREDDDGVDEHQTFQEIGRIQMRRIPLAIAGLLLCTSFTHAADIVNGWSPMTRITSIYSLTSLTMYKIADTTDGCGHPDYWQLPLTDTAYSKAKHAQLLAAFLAGKQVSLRCENSYVSDFQIFE